MNTYEVLLRFEDPKATDAVKVDGEGFILNDMGQLTILAEVAAAKLDINAQPGIKTVEQVATFPNGSFWYCRKLK